MMDIADWIAEYGGENYSWFIKRLSGNDTLANGSHQAGPYIPKGFIFDVLPALNRTDVKNPDLKFNLYVDSHMDAREVRAIYYNNKFSEGVKNGRNEVRITNFGGGASPLLDPESTGALTIFAFPAHADGDPECHVWVCRHATEEDVVEDRVGPIEPGRWVVKMASGTGAPDLFTAPPIRANCWLAPHEIPPAWLLKFPTGMEIIAKAAELRSDTSLAPDQRLMKRRECEYEIYKSVEEAIELPLIKAGFDSIEAFVARAQTILQRRKSRSGRSLELHARAIFGEEGLIENTHFTHQPESEPGKSPDFLFPSQAAYQDPSFPAANLRMLAVKTTCKDRWRQILNEANRVPEKHLLTLQEGISEAQFHEMVGANVKLVVPQPIIDKFPKSVQPHIQTLESFIGDIRLLST